MNEKEKDLYYLDDLPGYKVAEDYPDVRGWFVRDPDNRSLGKVDGLLVSKEAKKVVYLDVEVADTIMKTGREINDPPPPQAVQEMVEKNDDFEDHVLLPIGLTTLDEETRTVHTKKLYHDTFAGVKRFKKGRDLDRGYEALILTGFIPENEKGDPGYFYDQPAFKHERL